MFSKILIANRGEIACRVMTTARKLGVRTVAVYSDADRHAKHVAMADEAVHIGPPAVSESYLLKDKIIAAAKETGAEAIHPGYGFLSENASFVDAVTKAGLVFIGPSADAIRAMGLKDAAKSLMEKAGVPVVPGYHGENQDADFLAKEADKIGYPVLIKARAGGGGKGMRRVDDPKDFASALEGAQREGQASFGDPACLIEKYINQPRHVEIQVFGDAQGNVVYLFERDCSLQRRHQKVIEEAPAPDMPENVRAAMGKAAVEAAKAIGYTGAGTIEFIADGSKGLREDGFWFMEMNTRLQVEHPVTEAITGLDLVELQLRVASGEAMPFAQDDLSINGHAFEARIYAEDVPKGFLPATGTLAYLSNPDATEFELGDVRVDSGVRQGDTISPYYDPMIAKLIVHGPDRKAALARLDQALSETHIAGTVTNIAFLSALARHEGFGAGEVDTGLIGRDLDQLIADETPPLAAKALAGLAHLGVLSGSETTDLWRALNGWQHWGVAHQYVSLMSDGARIDLKVSASSEGYEISDGENTAMLAVSADDDGGYAVTVDGGDFAAHVALLPQMVVVFSDGHTYTFDIPDDLSDTGDADAGGDLVNAPMSGLIKAIKTEPGKAVVKGDPLIVMEAMKMEHTLTSPRDGIIESVNAKNGDQVGEGALLVKLATEESDG